MQPLQCTECGARVLVQKNSWEHTSIQWDDAARSRCREIGGTGPGRPGAPREGCAALTASIARAAQAGAVPVRDPDPVPTPVVVH
ncbi:MULTISPECIES: hypothetical protein [unclassified Rhodococcus (in: high G+C Gram-positive bacteria)]|uniref:hypothetical protein n=1 Tax=unclassified Rhodococcus (in: high G+C Gram-positive bacteria) TaxID=192944 RepID=UPI000B3C394E|nr:MULTISPECIES: hypothetical protein [unclassified Rhodococcus (in: high G+C Gram-positive bacteria)]KAF0959986.1 hypothetical protein MLGJGCBP_06931 [Rhodococcus sp. T7]OUS92303.1 hypothetical protein CA951_29385 [Rhodococcus sp. NCIMB 12038]